ncbi:hypothetical protein C1645_828284 [Glomus cerebriforme]|uniref:Uncharacterized protein n=1 Tax=Glomus cerebriforme TaxID=658196 RepID=A0A397SM14_9GLOM|nr:hypothetical protein C1645_828284 [Glomus cerebriforme]
MKAAYRKCRSLCGFKLYQEAIITIRNLHQRIDVNMNPSSVSMKQSTGSMWNLWFSKMRMDNHIVDEFYGRSKTKKDNKDNDVRVHKAGPRLVEEKGRGWIAKCDIPENNLLMVSKALKVVYDRKTLGKTTSNNTSDNKTTYDITPSRTEELMTSIVQKLLVEPYLCPEVYQLYNGVDKLHFDNVEKIFIYLVNVDIIGGAIKYNSFKLGDIYDENTELDGSELIKFWDLLTITTKDVPFLSKRYMIYIKQFVLNPFILSSTLCLPVHQRSPRHDLVITLSIIQRLGKITKTDIALLNVSLKRMKEAREWFDIALKRLIEAIMGKPKNDEVKWRKDAWYITEKNFPILNSTAK